MSIGTFFGSDQGIGGRVTLMGLPFDHGSEAPSGCSLGPSVLRQLSNKWSLKEKPIVSVEEGKVKLAPGDLSDIGDLQFRVQIGINRYLESISDISAEFALQGRPFLFIGGDHLATLGTIRGLARSVPEFDVIQIDAHSDCGEIPVGQNPTHANFIYEVIKLKQVRRVLQIGLRGYEQPWDSESGKIIRASERDLNEKLDRNVPVFLTVDSDGFDPIFLQAVNFPVHGGLTLERFKNLCERLELSGVPILGADWMEYNPNADTSNKTSAHFILGCLIELLAILKVNGGRKL